MFESFRDLLRGFVGRQNNDNSIFDENHSNGGHSNNNNFNENHLLNERNERRSAFPHFEIWSNPVEMHRYFQHEMEQMLRNFGNFGNREEGLGNDVFEQFFNGMSPGLPKGFQGGFRGLPQGKEGASDGDRDFMLKSDGSPDPRFYDHNKADKDLDEEIRDKDLSQLAPHLFQNHPDHHHNRQSNRVPQIFSFGQSFSEQIVTLPDGSVERRTTRSSSDGQNETTVTITRPNGQSETITSNDGGIDELRRDLVRPNIDLDKDRQSIFDFFFGRNPRH